jgi:hypothetical protein
MVAVRRSAVDFDQWDWMMQAHGQFAQAVDQRAGKILGGEALQPTATATSVRDDGQAVTDGPLWRPRRPWVAST